MILAYNEKTENEYIPREKYFTCMGDAYAFMTEHPDYTDYREKEDEGGIIGVDLVKTPKRVQNARLKALFGNRSFSEELEAPSTWSYNEKSWKTPQKKVSCADVTRELPEFAPEMPYSVKGNNYNEEKLEEYVSKLENEYGNTSENNPEDNTVCEIKSITDDGADEISAALTECTPEYWGKTAEEAEKNATVEALYLYYSSKTAFPEQYEDITYTGDVPSLPCRITNWNIRMILNVLSAYVFKPFWCQAGDKLIRIAPVIPAFTEEMAKRILKKRLYQGSAVVFDGKVFYHPGQCSGFTEDFPYEEFSLEKGLGLKFTKLPVIEELEIEKKIDNVKVSHFFTAPFCRNVKTVTFTDESYKTLCGHPDLLDEENGQWEFPEHCYPMSSRMRYRFLNIAFMYLFAEELGLSANYDDYYYSRNLICDSAVFRLETEEEMAERAYAPREERKERIAEAKRKAAIEKARIEAENARIAAEREKEEEKRRQQEEKRQQNAARKSVIRENDNPDKSLTVSEKEYEAALKKYIKDNGVDYIPVNDTGNSRVYKFFFENRHNKALMDKYPCSWTAAALYFFYGIDLRCYETVEKENTVPVYNEQFAGHVEKAKSFLKENSVSYDEFCYFMSSLNAIFNISVSPAYKDTTLAFDKKWAKKIPDAVYPYLHFFLLQSRNPALNGFISKCSLSGLTRYDGNTRPVINAYSKDADSRNGNGLDYVSSLLLRCAFPANPSNKLKNAFYKETCVRDAKSHILNGKMFVEGYIPIENSKKPGEYYWKQSCYKLELRENTTVTLSCKKIRGLVDIVNKSVFSLLPVLDSLYTKKEQKKLDLDVDKEILDYYLKCMEEKPPVFASLKTPSGEMSYKEFKTVYPDYVSLCNKTCESGVYDGSGDMKTWKRTLRYELPTWASWNKALSDTTDIDEIKKEVDKKLRRRGIMKTIAVGVFVVGTFFVVSRFF